MASKKKTNNQQEVIPPVDSQNTGMENQSQANTSEMKSKESQEEEVVVLTVRSFGFKGKAFLPLRRYTFKKEDALLLASQNKVRICI
jgi:hypothetical protein